MRGLHVVSAILVLIFIVGVAGAWFYVHSLVGKTTDEPVACTMEAMQCPDGSYVGRQGPTCEFAACPPYTDPTEGWKSGTNDKDSISFKYPENISATYISVVDWPPTITVDRGMALNCQAGDSTETPGGRTELKTISGRTYCVTATSEGAAGSTYTTYVYATAKDGDTIKTTFVLRTPQCLNYDDPQRSACTAEQSSFSIDDTINTIVGSIKDVAQSGTISGTAMVGPTCPVMKSPPDSACADKPYSGSFSLMTVDAKTKVKDFMTGNDGHFELSVAPGSYLIRQKNQQSLPRCGDVPVFLKADASQTISISCDSGIR